MEECGSSKKGWSFHRKKGVDMGIQRLYSTESVFLNIMEELGAGRKAPERGLIF
jgi:hypothetical protein